MYQDDPYLTPTSIADRKIFALSKEAGRKNARYVRDTKAQLFDYNVSHPVIQVICVKVCPNDPSKMCVGKVFV